MRLYLIRHAQAVPAGQGADRSRRLTDRGLRDAERAGRALREHEGQLQSILTSPLLRARETAERIASAFDPLLRVDIREELATGAPPGAYLGCVRDFPGEAVAMVGHMPDLAVLASILTGETISFGTSSIRCLDLLENRARLAWSRDSEP